MELNIAPPPPPEESLGIDDIDTSSARLKRVDTFIDAKNAEGADERIAADAKAGAAKAKAAEAARMDALRDANHIFTSPEQAKAAADKAREAKRAELAAEMLKNGETPR